MFVQWYVAAPFIGIGIAAFILGRPGPVKPFVHIGRSDRVFSNCRRLNSPYEVRPYLSNGHIETLFAAIFRKSAAVKYNRTVLTGPDGGQTAIDSPVTQELCKETPIVLLLPGLASSSRNTYVQHLAAITASAGFRTLVLNGRGCGSRLSTPKTFSASFTGDVRQLVVQLQVEYPQAPLFAVGWSLGANILLRYL
ncbi:hypothetical protein WJX84_003279, partial [Apatococcus fuscideae]